MLEVGVYYFLFMKCFVVTYDTDVGAVNGGLNMLGRDVLVRTDVKGFSNSA